MNVLMLSPGFPAEMPDFTRGLAEVGAQVIGLGDQPDGLLPEKARHALSHYVQVRSLWDEAQVVRDVTELAQRVAIDRVECLWEPGMILAARLREALSLPGMTVAQTIPFRDKEIMKQVLDEAGVRTPRHHRATSANGIREAAEDVGYPLIVKPIAGAGSADTYRVNDASELESVLPLLVGIAEVSVEEFIHGEEFTYDTICRDGAIVYRNICWYRPCPLIARTTSWISPQTVALRNLDQDDLAGGHAMGTAVLTALGYRTGFTHMEWFRKPDGEVVFGEIGCRPPGAHTVDLMNFAGDTNVYRGWAEAVTGLPFTQSLARPYNAASVFKRAIGDGRITRIEGLDRLMQRYGEHVVAVDLLPVGAPRRNWKATLKSDGGIVVRHPDLGMTMQIADFVGTDVQVYAGS